MIGLDTNILVRHLAQDDRVQSPRATRIIEGRLTTERPGFVSLVAIAETAWVLDRRFGLTGTELAAALDHVVETEVLKVQAEQEVVLAIRALQRGEGSFAGALIGALGARAGCEHTLTFDRQALRLPYFAAA